MGEKGGGTLELGGGNNKSITLDLSQIVSSDYALYGNLKIGSWGSGVFTGTFGGKGVKGGISVAGGANTMEFLGTSDGLSKIWIHGGTNTITFRQNVTITGNDGSGMIYAGMDYVSNNRGGNTINFEGAINTLTNERADAPVVDVAAGDGATVNNTYNKLNFTANNSKNTINGAISATSKYNNANAAGLNQLIFSGNGSTNTINGNIKATQGSINAIVFNGENSTNLINADLISATITGKNMILMQKETSLKDGIAIKIDHASTGLPTQSFNALSFAQSATLSISEVSVVGNYTSSSEKTQINAISFSPDTNNHVSIKVLSSSFGANVIGRNIVDSTNGTFGSALFEWKTDHNNSHAVIKDAIKTEFGKSDYTAGGNFVFGTQGSHSDVITANDSGGNFVNVATLIVNGNIKANGGNNYISASTGTNSITGDIDAQKSGTNNIAFGTKGSATINGNISSSWNGGGEENKIIFGGTINDLTSITTTAGTLKQNSTITGRITSNASSNTIIFNGSGVNTIGTQGQYVGENSATNSVVKTNGTNKISFMAGANSIYGNIYGEASRSTGGKTTIDFAGTTHHIYGGIKTLGNTQAHNLEAITAINVNSGALTIDGDVVYGMVEGGGQNGQNVFTLGASSTLTLKGETNQITNLDAQGTNTLTLDASNNAVNTTIDTLKGGTNLTVNFGAQNSDKTLAIKNVDSSARGTLHLKKITFDGASTNNTLDLSELNDKVTAITLTDKITVGNGERQGLSIRIKGLDSGSPRNVTFTGGIATTNGTSTIELTEGNATFSGGDINITNFDMTGSGASTATFKSTTTIGTLTAQASGGSNLVIGDGSTGASLTIKTTNSSITSVTLAGANSTFAINGGTQSIDTLTADATTANNLSFANNNLTIGEISNGGSDKVNLKLDNSTLTLGGKENNKDITLKTLAITNQATIDLSSPIPTTTRAGSVTPRRTLTIGGSSDSNAFSGNLNAVIFASSSGADKIEVKGSDSSGSITIFAQGNAEDILSITYDPKGSNNVQVAQVDSGSRDKVKVQGGVSEVDGVVVDLIVEEDKDNKGNYYIGKSVSKGVDRSIQQVASSALTVNYDLYIANFNSLNKRMGELRDNANSQGVWARVFGGAMSNDFGSGSKTNYVTAQAGYDYALSVGENAKNYTGVAIAYGKSWTKANGGIGLGRATLSNVDSQMVEVGVYNSYVADSGWYNDTILKFDYIMSDFTLKAGKVTADNSTNNFAMILSDEFGYRYTFGANEKGSWYIDPQLEVAFGYFNQSDFNHALTASGNITMNASQDSILTLRTRAGMSLGKKFTTESGFASIYVGAFYEYDYIDGGNVQTTVTGISNPLDSIESNGRAIVNVGSNIGLTKDARLYIDVEKSFGDEQRTFMQFNFGARYSF